MKKQYLQPLVSVLVIRNLERSICSAELPPLGDGGDLDDLGWN